MMFLKSERAAAETTGHVILLGMTVTGIAVIMLSGGHSIIKLQDTMYSMDMEQAYTVLDFRADQAALGDAPQQIIDIALKGGYISAQPNSSPAGSYVLFEAGTDLAPVMIPMGKIIYRKEEREIACEGGGVWSRYPQGSVMLSPPDFDYNGVTLNLRVINVSGNFSAGGKGTSSLIIRKKGDVRVIYPGGAHGNPVTSRINITIRSEYFDAWAGYFRRIPRTEVKLNPEEKTVTVTLDPPPAVSGSQYGLVASRKITMKNNAKTYSYNSSMGNHSATSSENGSIRANMEIALGKAVVNGDALTGGSITDFEGGHGSITKKACAGWISDTIDAGEKCPAVEEFSLPGAQGIVQDRISVYRSSNDNNKSSSRGCLRDGGNGNSILDARDWPGISCTISTGNYYLTAFIIPHDKELRFDTTSGAVNIVVDSSDVTLERDVKITVENGGSLNPVRLYLNRGFDSGPHVEINPGDKATLFQVISSTSQKMDFPANDVYFCGLIWAPEASITIGNKMQFYGAVAGKDITLEEGTELYFDEALQNISVGDWIAPQYVYISRNDIETSII